MSLCWMKKVHSVSRNGMGLTCHLLTEDVGWRQSLSVVDAVVEDAHDAAAGDGPDEDVAVVAR